MTPDDPRFPVAVAVCDAVIHGKLENLDFDNATVKTVLDGLVAAAFIGTEQRAALDAMANVTETPARRLRWFRPITAADVATARAA